MCAQRVCTRVDGTMGRLTCCVACCVCAYVFTAKYDVIVHGVRVPGETPALWLCASMPHADNFCYVVVRNRSVVTVH